MVGDEKEKVVWATWIRDEKPELSELIVNSETVIVKGEVDPELGGVIENAAGDRAGQSGHSPRNPA